MTLARLLSALESGLDRLCAAGAWLALPVSLLLFAQWPLRDVAGGQPQLANDSAQALFALYVALALRHALRRGQHLRAPGWGVRLGPAARLRFERVGRIASAAVLLPWSAVLLWLGAPQIWQSLAQWERFPDTLHPGYFAIKLAVGLMLALVGLQAVLDLRSPQPPDTQAPAA